MENATQCDGIMRMRLVGMTILHINVYYYLLHIFVRPMIVQQCPQ